MTLEIFFLKNHAQNVVEKLSPESFEKSKLNISLHQQSEVSNSLFLLYVQVEDYHMMSTSWKIME